MRPGLDRDPAVLPFDRLPHDRQTDPGTAELAARVKAPERLEDLFGEFRIEAHAVVGHA